MNLDELTIGQVKELVALLGASKTSLRVDGDGRHVIVRARDAGVHFGKLAGYEGRIVWLTDARRMWKWKAAKGISLSECAEFGVDHNNSKICCTVSKISIHDVAEIIDCSITGAASIIATPFYTL
jgi:hypothetical protein